MNYKHTQISYLMIVLTLVVPVFFAWAYITASVEPLSYYSGKNLVITTTMILILASFESFQIMIDKKNYELNLVWYLAKKFSLNDIAFVKIVRNH